MKNKGIMIDIETLGTKVNTIILSIAAVEFNINTGETFRDFHEKIDIDSCIDAGLTFDKKTIMWWLKQSKEAQDGIIQHTGKNLHKVLQSLSDFIKKTDANSDVEIWGNSARFDLGILQHAFDILRLGIPWDYRNERDVRTLVAISPETKKAVEFKGIRHNALDDCYYQIDYCSKTYQQLKNK